MLILLRFLIFFRASSMLVLFLEILSSYTCGLGNCEIFGRCAKFIARIVGGGCENRVEDVRQVWFWRYAADASDGCAGAVIEGIRDVAKELIDSDDEAGKANPFYGMVEVKVDILA
jgi:hypothetical protein